MELQQLRYIVAVDQEKNFSRAAERVFISQPTLSQQIRKLERELGVDLFERSTRKATLTPAGELFIPIVREFLEKLDAAVQEVKDQSGDMKGKIRVAVIPTIAPYFIPKIIPTIKKKAPKIHLEVHELTTSVLLQKLSAGEIDLGILALPIDQAGIESESIGTEPILAAVSKTHPLVKKKTLKMADIIQEKLLILQEGHCFRDQSLEFCKRTADDQEVVFQGSSLESVIKMASSGEGLTFVPSMAIDQKAYPRIRFIPFQSPSPNRELGYVWRKTTSLSKSQNFFLSLATETLKKSIKN